MHVLAAAVYYTCAIISYIYLIGMYILYYDGIKLLTLENTFSCSITKVYMTVGIIIYSSVQARFYFFLIFEVIDPAC